MKTSHLLSFAIVLIATSLETSAIAEPAIASVLETHCGKCHGATKQKGNLRLDSRAAALRGGDEGTALVPNEPDRSPLLTRLTASDPELRMPPEGPSVPKADIERIRAWIAAGAPWQESAAEQERTERARNHWAIQPVRGGFPAGTTIDSLIGQSLRANGLSPSSEADRRTLIRRLSFDLHGLPPSPEQVDSFIKDPDENAYAKLVDTFLASPRYGERWARHWLDIAHYADTHGFERDQLRPNAWRYRDYVIDSLNRDKPYDLFLREQIAGDIVSPTNPESIIATGFLAAGPWDFVGNVETRSEVLRRAARAADLDDMITQVITASVGLTINCARCHDHKLDPISQREYFSLISIFSGTKRADRDVDPTQSERVQKERSRLKEQLGKIRSEIAKLSGQGLDLADMVGGGDGTGTGRKGFGVDPRTGNTTGDKLGYHRDIQTNRLQRIAWPSDLQKLSHALEWIFVPDGSGDVKVGLNQSITGIPKTSGHAWDAIRNGPLNAQRSTTLDGTDFATAGHSILGMHANIGATFNLKTIRAQIGSAPLRLSGTIGFGADASASKSRADMTVIIDSYVAFQRLGLRKDETCLLDISIPTDASTFSIIATDGGDGIGNDLLFIGDPRIAPDAATVARSPSDESRLQDLRTQAQSVELSLKDLPDPAKVFAIVTEQKPKAIKMQRRGNPEDETQEVIPATISWLRHTKPEIGDNDLPEGERRRSLAAWITHPDNPLTRRVIVNRLWHHHFGSGMVLTPSDFGLGGDKPSHPELLDWLADQLIQNRWSLKAVHRLILLSQTYRQSSLVDEQHLAAQSMDTQNRLLWRQNPRRLDAESIRDSVLAVSGDLNLSTGGPGFRDFKYTEAYAPIYQYITPETPEHFRRSIYRFIVRTTPHQLMTTLDCPDPANLTPARVQTTTPLQALVMSNNPFFLKQSQRLANSLATAHALPPEQIRAAFLQTLQRPPTPNEADAGRALLERSDLTGLCRMLINSNEFIHID